MDTPTPTTRDDTGPGGAPPGRIATDTPRSQPLAGARAARPLTRMEQRDLWRTIGYENESAERLARGLGWLSLGLGVAQIAAPRAVARAIGVRPRPGVMRAIGAREIAAGIGILGRRRPAGWTWGRVAGDVLDLAMLGAALRRAGEARRGRIAMATAAVAGVAILDVVCSVQFGRRGGARRASAGLLQEPGRVQRSITVNCAPEEAYRSWRRAWLGPDAEIVDEIEGTSLSWRARGNGHGGAIGSALFEPARQGRGTVVRIVLRLSPDGSAGSAGAFSGIRTKRRVQEDLRRFKQITETGEIATTEGQPAGRRSRLYRRFVKRIMP